MGTILIHAGMPKTGSTSIQAWLGAHVDELRERHGISVLREVGEAFERPVRFDLAPRGRGIGGHRFLLHYESLQVSGGDAQARSDLVAELVGALEAAVAEAGTVLLSSEGFSTMFVRGDAVFLAGLEQLAQRHTVRVVCYVRSQHLALEARWRQWGFRNLGEPPQTWVRSQSAQLRYLEMLGHADRHAPAVSFELQPFRADLLLGADVVVDFASRFCAVEPPADARRLRENLGLPLDLAILLRSAGDAAASLLDSTGPAPIEGGIRQVRLGELCRHWSIADSPAAARSREILHAYAYQEFESENRELSARLGWGAKGLIEPPPDSRPFDLAELDHLWAPDQSLALAYLIAALDDLLPGDAHS